MTTEAREQAAALEAAAAAKRELSELSAVYHEAKAESDDAERRADMAVAEAAAQRAGNEQLLKRLLEEQRTALEADCAELRVRLAAKTEAQERAARVEVLRKVARSPHLTAPRRVPLRAAVCHCVPPYAACLAPRHG